MKIIKKNQLKIVIFRAIKYRSILHKEGGGNKEKVGEMVSVRGEKRLRTNEMGAGKEYGERDWEKEK